MQRRVKVVGALREHVCASVLLISFHLSYSSDDKLTSSLIVHEHLVLLITGKQTASDFRLLCFGI